jgi:hypothetical protein
VRKYQVSARDYRGMAEEIRTVADEMTDQAAANALRAVARDYDLMAESAQRYDESERLLRELAD